ncbi:DHA2 family efflux MFS transporter permease subunit [Kineococcus glutinatus]|uniref:DHA2 family efflux MFS transporter permease subunit n=1 Tax=Kineococcus glutinatus TaxID=1070872 RepID=UPI0031ECFA7B
MPELTRRRRILVLAVCCTSLFLGSVDNTIVNVALPAIGRDLGAPVSGMQWVVDSYTLVLGSLLLLSGSTADRIGRRRTFQVGLVVFTLGSVLCGLAPGLGWLVAFRVVQAVGGSMLNPVAMSIIVNVFPDPRERARAIGVWGAVAGLSMALGPLLGGLLVDTAGWEAVFWVNAPVGVAAVVLTALFVPESRAPRPRRVDPLGQVLVLVVLASLLSGLIEGPHRGWASAPILALFAAAAAALAGLVAWELRRAEPLLDVRLFRNPPFAGAVVIAVCGFAAFGGFLLLNTLYLQESRGLSALHAGLWTLPMALTAALVAPLSGRIVAGHGPRWPLVVAGAATALAGVQLTALDAGAPPLQLVAAYVAVGLGFGMLNAPVTTTAVAGLPADQAGVAAAVASTSRQVGQALGVAVLGAVVAAGLAGAPMAAGLPAASHAAWWVVAGCGVAITVLGVTTTGRRA